MTEPCFCNDACASLVSYCRLFTHGSHCSVCCIRYLPTILGPIPVSYPLKVSNCRPKIILCHIHCVSVWGARTSIADKLTLSHDKRFFRIIGHWSLGCVYLSPSPPPPSLFCVCMCVCACVCVLNTRAT